MPLDRRRIDGFRRGEESSKSSRRGERRARVWKSGAVITRSRHSRNKACSVPANATTYPNVGGKKRNGDRLESEHEIPRRKYGPPADSAAGRAITADRDASNDNLEPSDSDSLATVR